MHCLDLWAGVRIGTAGLRSGEESGVVADVVRNGYLARLDVDVASQPNDAANEWWRVGDVANDARGDG